MIIGVPKEIKIEEFRVGITPSGVLELKQSGHTVLIETTAGVGSGFPDEDYRRAGARLVDKEQLFAQAELIIKVKEPLAGEYEFLRNDQALFTYLHLAPNPRLTGALIEKNITALGYETLTKDGALPLLAPMSEIAGRMAPLMGAYHLQRFKGGTGVLPTGVSGVKPGKIVILGAGVVGANATRVAAGLGMDIVVLNKGEERLRKIDELFMGRVKTLPLTRQDVEAEIKDADLVICALLVPGGRTPVFITRNMLSTMKQGAVIVDVSVDQGGCAETARPTTHDNPVYEVDGVIHYCVANMPGAYPRTSTLALTNATLPYISLLATVGIDKAISDNEQVRSALNTYRGELMNKALADAMGPTMV